jgi:hypothetical protein
MSPYSWFDAGVENGLQLLWEDGERIFCRRSRDGNAVLAVLPAAEHPTLGSLNRLTHEYGLKILWGRRRDSCCKIVASINNPH